MLMHMNRWMYAAIWIAAMSLVWALFVPASLSHENFAWVAFALALAWTVTNMIWKSGAPPRSVPQLLHDLETEPASPGGARGPSGLRGE